MIIPDFGGFVLNETDAGFIDNNHKLVPSGKKPSFNRNLNVNDGILANFISKEEGISYSESLSRVKNIVDGWKSTLNESGLVFFDGVGSLSANQENKIIFEPADSRNYLRSSYGLPAIILSPVEKQNSQKIFQLHADPDSGTNRTGKIIRRAVSISAVAASLLLAFVFIFNNTFFRNTNLAFFGGSKINSASVIKSIQPIASSIGSIIDESTAKPVQKQVQDSFSVPNPNFYIVGGSFKIEANAAKFVKELKEKGFKAQLLNNEDGWYRVSYLAEQDSLKADKDLHSIKINENQSAWLLKF